MIKLIIFDLDDTLYACYDVLFPKAVRLAAKALIDAGLQMTIADFVKKVDDYYNSGHSNYKNVLRNIVSGAGVPESDHDRLFDIAMTAYDSIDATGIELFPGVKDMLTGLKEKYKLAVLTYGKVELQNQKIDELGVRELFDYIEVVSSKKYETKEEALRQFLGRNGFTPEEIVFLGDNPSNDILAGNNVGVTTVRLKKWKYANVDPTEGPEKADYTIDNPLDIVSVLEKL